MPSLFAGRSLSDAARRQRGSSGISEVYRPPGSGGELSMGSAGPPRPGPCLCNAGEHSQSPRRIPGFSQPLEGRRPRYTHHEASQSRVRQAAIVDETHLLPVLAVSNSLRQCRNSLHTEISKRTISRLYSGKRIADRLFGKVSRYGATSSEK